MHPVSLAFLLPTAAHSVRQTGSNPEAPPPSWTPELSTAWALGPRAFMLFAFRRLAILIGCVLAAAGAFVFFAAFPEVLAAIAGIGAVLAVVVSFATPEDQRAEWQDVLVNLWEDAFDGDGDWDGGWFGDD